MRIFRLSNFLQAKVNIFLYMVFGWKLARFYIFFLGRIYFFIKNREKQVIEKSVLEVMRMIRNDDDRDKTLKRVFNGILYHYYEKLYIAFESKRKATGFLSSSVICNDLALIKKALLNGRGVILITGHYGAIEFIPTLLAIKNINISMIARFKTAQLRKKVFAQAEKYNIKMIDAEKSGNVFHHAISELKENRVLVTQCDEIDEWRPSDRKRTTFLGQITGLDRTINIMQKRSGAEVLFGVIHRYSLSKYELIVYSHDDMLRMINSSNSITTGEAVLKVLEQFIYHYPEQWYQWKKYPQLCGSRSFREPATIRDTAGPVLRPLLERHV